MRFDSIRPIHQPLRFLAQALLESGDLIEAERVCRASLTMQPNDASALAVLAAILNGLGRHEEAIGAAQAAVQLKPNLPNAHFNLGIALRGRKRMHEALPALIRAVELHPNDPTAARELATLLTGFGQATQAMETIEKAMKFSPASADLHNVAGSVLHRAGQIPEAIEQFRRAIELNPHLILAASNVLLAMHSLDDMSPQALFDEHLAWARRYAPPLPQESRFVHANPRVENRPLRIGYISADFRYHSVAHFLRNIIAQHDRTQFEIVCYSSVVAPDAWTIDFQKMNVTWRDTARGNDAQLAAQIQADAIDIAVDCAGHSSGHRLVALTRRPAPVQVTFLGYPSTTGLEAIDYRITDAIADPPGESDRLNVEKLVRLEPTAWCYAAAKDAPPCAATREEGPIRFGSFTTLAKLTPRWIGVWCDILRRVPDSRLLLKSSCLNDAGVRSRLIAHFASGGISGDRVELLQRQSSAAEHLATYGRVDIALDTFPYHGTTTTCEALYMGVPVITLAGGMHASRVGASLLAAVGLHELVAEDQAAYVEKALRLAGDANKVRELHTTLRSRMESSPLMDAGAYVAGLERAYREMWQAWCRKTS